MLPLGLNRIFHDATCKSVSFDWKAGSCRIRLSLVLGRGSGVISASGVKGISIARDQPWGFSEDVNAVTIARHAEHVRCDIEMQSGDHMIVSADVVEWVPDAE